ncbi:ROK family protein [Listeria seeligeri]|uniref:ROK family protein n=1 Tax=Listeria seeligeri TaxID=1640 RepID=UPI0016290E31|nr:ROK family protein [Listeria seeligeri]MBC1539517.1 ROK family protein [Listeria seeligeri]MBC1556473.1 ROK family protein [Listeria seeligeri]MBC1735280.1 ROK family protein [Listeria seeligeri]MBC6123967.1 ROK family protein [Listeria seeligeri]MBF2540024.1 ROK family protein [Listeria seeligeri]
MTILAFDMGGTAVKYGVLTNQGELLEKGKFATPDNLDELIRLLVEVKTTYDYSFQGVAFSCPGAVNNETGIIGGASAIPYIHHFPFRQLLEEKLALPVTMENDANCAALAEVWLGAAKDKQDIIFMILGTGVGGSVIRDGKVHHGANLHGGEFGYMLMDQEGHTLSDLGTVVNAAKRIGERLVPTEEIDGVRAFELREEGNLIATEELKTMFYHLARSIFNLQYALDPELVVIGGAVSERAGFIEELNSYVDEVKASVPIAKIRPTVVGCEFGNDANLIGATAFHLA